MHGIAEKGGGTFEGVKLLLCENPLSPSVLLLTPTYTLFTEISGRYTETCLSSLHDFAFDLQRLVIPDGSTLVVIVNPNNTTETCFFLADFAPHDAAIVAERLKTRGFLMKPLNDERLGLGYMRITTALPEDNRRFIAALEQVLLCGSTAMEQGG